MVTLLGTVFETERLCLRPLLQKFETRLEYPTVERSSERRFLFFNPPRSVIMAVKVESDKCTGCGECVSACPLDAIVIKDGKAVVDDTCAECGACIDVCPNKALVL